MDVVAERPGERLYAEVKGSTAAAGLEVSTAYGQLLSRMSAQDDSTARYALVVRDEPRSVRAAVRVPARVLALLRASIYAVAEDGSVRELPGRS